MRNFKKLSEIFLIELQCKANNKIEDTTNYC